MTAMDLEGDDRRAAVVADAYNNYQRRVSPHYDEVLEEVSARIVDRGYVSKGDIGSLVLWKRLNASTKWASQLMQTSDTVVAQHTGPMVTALTETADVPAAASLARAALSPLPGFSTGDALASAVIVAASPARMAVYDRRAHAALSHLGLTLTNLPGRYRRYMTAVENPRRVCATYGRDLTARQIDQALFQLGARRSTSLRDLRIKHALTR